MLARSPSIQALAPLARMYLAIPASSADLERAFSSAGFLNTCRESLSTETLEMQVVLRDWILEQYQEHDNDRAEIEDACARLVQTMLAAADENA